MGQLLNGLPCGLYSDVPHLPDQGFPYAIPQPIRVFLMQILEISYRIRIVGRHNHLIRLWLPVWHLGGDDGVAVGLDRGVVRVDLPLVLRDGGQHDSCRFEGFLAGRAVPRECPPEPACPCPHLVHLDQRGLLWQCGRLEVSDREPCPRTGFPSTTSSGATAGGLHERLHALAFAAPDGVGNCDRTPLTRCVLHNQSCCCMGSIQFSRHGRCV